MGGLELFVPPKPARHAEKQGRELEPKPGDSQALLAWKRRVASEDGKEIFKQRAATSETVNVDLRSCRGLSRFTVRGLKNSRCVALWCALAYNLMHLSSSTRYCVVTPFTVVEMQSPMPSHMMLTAVQLTDADSSQMKAMRSMSHRSSFNDET